MLEVVPAAEVRLPALLQATGKATLDGDFLTLTGIEAAAGRTTDLEVLLPAGHKVARLSINGRDFTAFQSRHDVLRVPVTFAGTRIDHCQQLGAYDASFASQGFSAQFTVPHQVFNQLAARRKAWPVLYTAEELLATWRGSGRLLLFIQIADPNDQWQLHLKIDGQPLEVRKAYSNVFPLGRERTFTGSYADLTHIQPDTPHQVEVMLPAGLQPGQFQGLFLENVEALFTEELAP